VKITDVLYTPGMSAALISMARLDCAGYEFCVKDSKMKVFNPAGHRIAMLVNSNGLYTLGRTHLVACALTVKLTLDELH
jgi:hypothetical protein